MEKVWDSIQHVYAYNPLGWNAASGVLLVAGTVCLSRMADIRNFWRGRMDKRTRRLFVINQATYDLVDKTEERVATGDITRSEATMIYTDAKKLWPLRSLFPNPKLLIEAIQKRMANGEHSPVNLPDKKGTFKRKHLFDKPA